MGRGPVDYGLGWVGSGRYQRLFIFGLEYVLVLLVYSVRLPLYDRRCIAFAVALIFTYITLYVYG